MPAPYGTYWISGGSSSARRQSTSACRQTGLVRLEIRPVQITLQSALLVIKHVADESHWLRAGFHRQTGRPQRLTGGAGGENPGYGRGSQRPSCWTSSW